MTPTATAPRIVTCFVYPPIPTNRYDWQAVDDDTYEPGCPIGYGATEAEAVANLLELLEDEEGQ